MPASSRPPGEGPAHSGRARARWSSLLASYLSCKTETGFPEPEPLVSLPFSVTPCRPSSQLGLAQPEPGSLPRPAWCSRQPLPGCRCPLTQSHLPEQFRRFSGQGGCQAPCHCWAGTGTGLRFAPWGAQESWPGMCRAQTSASSRQQGESGERRRRACGEGVLRNWPCSGPGQLSQDPASRAGEGSSSVPHRLALCGLSWD